MKLPTMLVLWALALGCGKAGIHAPADSYSITKSGIAGIQLEMTLREAREAVPSAECKRVSDGDAAALVLVTFAPNASLMLWAGEDDASAPIDWSKHVKTIEAFGSAFHTREGIYPGTLVTDVEKSVREDARDSEERNRIARVHRVRGAARLPHVQTESYGDSSRARTTHPGVPAWRQNLVHYRVGIRIPVNDRRVA